MRRKRKKYFSNKKILYIHKSGPGWGGAQQNVYDLINHFKDEFGEAVFVCNRGLLLKKIKTLKVKTYKIPISSRKYLPLTLAKLTKILKTEKPDIIHSNHRFATLLVQMLRTVLPFEYKIVHTARSVFSTYTKLPFFGDKLIANSHAVEKNLIEQFNILPEKIAVIYDGVELKLNSHFLLKEQNDPVFQMLDTCQRTIIGCVGSLVEAKGHSSLLQALARLDPEIQQKILVLIIGDGPLRKKLEALAEEHDLSDTVKFLGFRNDVHHILSYCQFIVVPSIQEGLPNIVVEAYLLGKPAIVSELDYVEEIISPYSLGLTFSPGDTQRLADAIQQYIEKPKLATKHGNKGKRALKKPFSLKGNIANYRQAYQDVLEL